MIASTALRRTWLEWRAGGWRGTLLLLGGAVLAASSVTTLSPSRAAFEAAVLLAMALGFAITLLPSPGSDRAWEITGAAAEPPGTQQWRALSALLVVALVLLTALTWWQAPALPASQVWGWFAPRAAWFAGPALLLLARTGQPAWAAAAVTGMVVARYCLLPDAYNVARFEEPRVSLHALTGGLLLLGVVWPWTWLPIRARQRWGAGLLLAGLVLIPALVSPLREVRPVPPGTPEGWVVLQAPWSQVRSQALERVQRAAGDAGQSLRVLTVLPEQGEPDGSDLARHLGVKRLPVLLEVQGGGARPLPWSF